MLLETFRNIRVCQGGIFFFTVQHKSLMLLADKAQVLVKKGIKFSLTLKMFHIKPQV